MPRVRKQHQWKDKDHVPSSRWPDDCFVQWGSGGVVFAGAKSYSTAFFEAFPKKGSFIRGEGETIAEAEKKALDQYEKENGCIHVMRRGKYTNGGAHCARCGGFFADAFPPIVRLGAWRDPLNTFEIEMAIDGLLVDDPGQDRGRQRYRKRTRLRLAAAGFELPLPPAEPEEVSLLEETPYALACKEAVFSRIKEKGGLGAMMAETCPDGVFDLLAARLLKRRYEEWLQRQSGVDHDLPSP